MLADAIEKGWITPARSNTPFAIPRRPVAPLEELLLELEADRADR